MRFKEILKKLPVIRFIHRKLHINSRIALLGLLPISINRNPGIKKFLADRVTFKKLGGIITHSHIIIDEYESAAGTAQGHYFHQDLLVAQFIFQANPQRHIDIGSRIDGFVAHVATFRKIEIYDIRTLNDCGHSNIEFKQADLMLGLESNVTDSISCLHTIEHFGLGRYGDHINPKGHVVGIEFLVKMLKPGGILYISFPIGKKNEVHFNAHRVFHPKDIFSWAPNSLNLIRFDYVDDTGKLHQNFDLFNSELVVTYGCGIYTFCKV